MTDNDLSRSPLCCLENGIAGVAFNIAPERQRDLVDIRNQYNIELYFADKKGFGIAIDVTTGLITLPVAALEYLWICAYNYWVVTQEYAQCQRDRKGNFDVLGNKRLKDAARLLQWSNQNIRTTGKDKWPPELPLPVKGLDSTSDIRVANELFLAALGWIVHHEIGHVVLGHSSIVKAFSQREEKDADIYSTDWILSCLEEPDPSFKKRALGIAVGLLCLQSLEIGLSPSAIESHPRAHVRLNHCLNRYEFTEKEAVDAFAVVVLQWLFHDEGIKANIDGLTFGSILSDFLVDVERSG